MKMPDMGSVICLLYRTSEDGAAQRVVLCKEESKFEESSNFDPGAVTQVLFGMAINIKQASHFRVSPN